MSLILADRVLETTTTTGTGNIALAGALTGFRAFSSVMVNTDTTYYYISAVDSNGVPTAEWETGIGTWNTGNTLTRTTVQQSSNSNAAVAFAAGTKRIAISLTAGSLKAVVAPVRRSVGGTTDTLVVADANNYVDYTSTSAIGVSITTAFTGLSTNLTWPTGAGTITITPTGVTLNGSSSPLVLSANGGAVSIMEIGTNAFRVVGSIGDLVAADITDSTTTGRAVLTATDAAAGRTALAVAPAPTLGTTITASGNLTTAHLDKVTPVDTSGGAVAMTLNTGVLPVLGRIVLQRRGANALTIVAGTGTVSDPNAVVVADGAFIGLLGDPLTADKGVIV